MRQKADAVRVRNVNVKIVENKMEKFKLGDKVKVLTNGWENVSSTSDSGEICETWIQKGGVRVSQRDFELFESETWEVTSVCEANVRILLRQSHADLVIDLPHSYLTPAFEQFKPVSSAELKKAEEPNPSCKHDTAKLRYDLLPPECLEAVAKILTFGAEKYGANNWQQLEDFESRYYAAMERHLQAWRMGEHIDPESGQLHLAHVACNAVFLLWKELKTK